MSQTTKLPNLVRPSDQSGPVEAGKQSVNVANLLAGYERIGEEIRDPRKTRDFTLTKLSQLIGLSQSYLSQVERGISKPSIKTLHSISRALGVTISWFFSPTFTGEDCVRDVVVRANQHRHLTFKSGITDKLLSPNLRREIELLRCTFPLRALSGSEPFSHQGGEAVIALAKDIYGPRSSLC